MRVFVSLTDKLKQGLMLPNNSLYLTRGASTPLAGELNCYALRKDRA